MADEKPYIDPNSGSATQPGGRAVYAYELPPTEQKDIDVKSQIQDDPEGLAATQPDENIVPEALTKKLEQEQQESEENTTERTGEVTDGTGRSIVSPEQAEAQGGVSPSPGSAGLDQASNDPEKGQLSSPQDAKEPGKVEVPKGEEGARGAGSGDAAVSPADDDEPKKRTRRGSAS